MLALISFILSTLCFLFAALSVKVGDLHLVDWGLFLLALGFVLQYAWPYVTRTRSPNQAP